MTSFYLVDLEQEEKNTKEGGRLERVGGGALMASVEYLGRLSHKSHTSDCQPT